MEIRDPPNPGTRAGAAILCLGPALFQSFLLCLTFSGKIWIIDRVIVLKNRDERLRIIPKSSWQRQSSRSSRYKYGIKYRFPRLLLKLNVTENLMTKIDIIE